jgi:hypothetical protein
MIRPLSIYSENSRSGGPAAKLKWQSDNEIRIFGYPYIHNLIRLSLVRLNNKSVLETDTNIPDFLTDIPVTRGMKTATGGGRVVIETGIKQNRLTIHTDGFSYNVETVKSQNVIKFKQKYLPMEQFQMYGSLQASIFKNFLYLTRGGPLRLKISNESATFFSKQMSGIRSGDNVTLDITSNTETDHGKNELEYKYNIYLISEALRKFPSKKQIELFVNEDLIRFRYELDDGIGYVNYYQRSK